VSYAGGEPLNLGLGGAEVDVDHVEVVGQLSEDLGGPSGVRLGAVGAGAGGWLICQRR
jgi:hypothetical protein